MELMVIHMMIIYATAMECMSRFCMAMVSVFGSDYLRTSNEEDVAHILA
jgi:Na+/proline symporter